MCESGAKTFCTLHSEVWVPGMGLESPWIPQPNLPHSRWKWWWGELGENYEGDFEDCLNIALSGIPDHDEDKINNACGQVGSLLGEHRGRGGRDRQLSGEQYCQHVSRWWWWWCYFEKPNPLQKVEKPSPTWNVTNLSTTTKLTTFTILIIRTNGRFPRNNTLSFGHSPNWVGGGMTAEIDFDTF